MSRTLELAAIGVSVMLLAGACAAGSNSDGRAALDGTGDPTAGRELFGNTCATCHGTQLDGTDTGPPLIHEYYVPGHHSDAAFLLATQRGVQPHHWDYGPMPAVPGLSAEEVADIIAFVRQQQRDAGLIE